MTRGVVFADVVAAADRIRGMVHRTPVVRSTTIDREIGAEIHFKCENLQKVGAFKARGACNAILSLADDVAGRGVVTHSSGNHGQAVAYAASRRSIPAWVVMPDDASPVKVAAVGAYGAAIVRCPRSEREAVASRLASETGAALIHPYDDPAVIAGQGTAALELLDEAPGVDILLAPVGGGGLLSGTAVAASGRAPGAAIVGVEPAAAADALRSLQSGVRQPAVADADTICDGLLTGLGEIPFAILTAADASIVVVDDDAVARACSTFLTTMKLLVEPSGGTVLAAMRAEPERFAGKRVGVILSGGNTDLSWLGADQRQ